MTTAAAHARMIATVDEMFESDASAAADRRELARLRNAMDEANAIIEDLHEENAILRGELASARQATGMWTEVAA